MEKCKQFTVKLPVRLENLWLMEPNPEVAPLWCFSGGFSMYPGLLCAPF